MQFRNIPQFPRSNYQVTVHLRDIKRTLEDYNQKQESSPLILNPEWQRGHVWNQRQKEKYMEYFLMGGTTGRNIYFNCSSWMGKFNTPVYLLDGLQRITACLEFLDDKVTVFGHKFSDFTDKYIDNYFTFHVLTLKNKRELLQIYINHNSGGTAHDPKEIERIQKMIEYTNPNDTL